MRSTYPHIAHYTPALLSAVCRQQGMTTEQLRLGTLKRVDVELANLLDCPTYLHPDHVESLRDLHNQVRLAIGDE